MTIGLLTILVWAGSFVGGLLGAMTGLGGGFVIVPLLTLVFHVDLRYAIGASLIAVIATSSGAGAAYVQEGYTNLRVAMFLEIATTIGAVIGAVIATQVDAAIISIIFGIVLITSAFMTLRGHAAHRVDTQSDALGRWLRLASSYPADDGRSASYGVQRVPLGFSLMGLAGVLSGLLGIGSGALKVLALDQAMRLPLKVSTTTSNFMIGVTAAASAGIYLQRGYIDPGLAMPVMLGVLPGALLGARVLKHSNPRALRIVFTAVLFVVAVQMIFNGVRGEV